MRFELFKYRINDKILLILLECTMQLMQQATFYWQPAEINI